VANAAQSSPAGVRAARTQRADLHASADFRSPSRTRTVAARDWRPGASALEPMPGHGAAKANRAAETVAGVAPAGELPKTAAVVAGERVAGPARHGRDG
jgi:hypothetical protein